MRGIGRWLRMLTRRPAWLFGCLVFFLGGFSLAMWPLAIVGPILALITLFTIVTGLTLTWRNASWFCRVWVDGLILAAAAALIALLNIGTPRGLLFQVVVLLSLLPAGRALIRSPLRRRQAGMLDRHEPALARATREPMPTPEVTDVTTLPPLLRRKLKYDNNRMEVVDAELLPPLSRWLTQHNESQSSSVSRDGGGDRDLLAQLLSASPEPEYGN